MIDGNVSSTGRRRRVARRLAPIGLSALLLPLIPAPGVAQAGGPAVDVREAAPAAPSAAMGRIDGRVLDGETGRALPGAEIVLKRSGRRTLAGVDGRFSLREVAPGEREVTVSFLGYAPKTVAGLRVGGSQPIWIEVTLVPAAVELEGIRVSAARASGSRSGTLAVQRAALGVVNAIGSEQIARSPDGDAADAIRRVSGVSVQDGRYVFVRGLGERYTTASLNGARIPSPDPERRVVPLDLFPSGLIESITTAKTFTADRPGDFSGGQVDIRTREFPAERQVTVSLSTTYRPEVENGTWLSAPSESLDWLAMGADARRIPSDADGFVSASRGPEVNRVVNAFRNTWSAREGSAPMSGSLGISLGGRGPVLDHDIGYLVSGTYSAGPEMALDQRRAMAGAGGTEYNRYDGRSGRHSVLWGGLANLSSLIGNHTRVLLNNSYNRSADNEARLEIGTDEDTNSRVRIDRLQYTERVVRSNQVQVEHQLGTRHTVDWAVTSSGVQRDEPDRSEFVTWLDPQVPTWFKHEEGAVRSFGTLEESSWEAAASYALTFGPSARPHTLRVGGLYRTTGRDAESQVFRIQPFDWSETDTRWQADAETIFDGRYAQPEDDSFLLARDRAGGSYAAEEQVSAAFLLAEIALTSRLGLVAGARVERSELVLDYESQLGSVGSVEPAYTDLLPSVALNLDLTDAQKLRLSTARTLARPEYREIAPIAYREVLGGEQVIGNPDLKRTLIENYDLRWEWYPGYDETVTIGVFAKRFRDPIEQRFLARSGTDTRTFENADRALNYGVELEAVRNLGFLAESLLPFSLFTNVTLMRSEVDTGREDDERRAMVGQAPYVVNTGLTWAADASDLSATVLYNVVGPRIVNARASGSQVDDVVEAPRPTLDLSVRFPTLWGVAGKIDLKNLLDSPYRVEQGSVVRAYHRTGRSVSLGLSWRR